MPDYKSRVNILKANLKKSPLGQDVDLNFIAKITEGFSGADLTEVCQKAAKMAVRESIVADARIKAMKEANPNYVAPADPVPFISKAHFEEALKTSRRSVSQTDLDRFEQFRKKFDPSFVSTGFSMPQA